MQFNSSIDFIPVGYLNSKSKSIRCNTQDPSGDVLNQILDKTIMHNDGNPSYFQHQAASRADSVQYIEILDLVLSSDSSVHFKPPFE